MRLASLAAARSGVAVLPRSSASAGKTDSEASKASVGVSEANVAASEA
ncbi:MAG: hypothetical protein LBK04_02800 [Clostridiales Family XIII bacterium]|nr:hypothetical protein [Clostridiales Family XIII bacterium]